MRPEHRAPVRTLLVANRGEIARRIIRTAASMGIRTVAVYSADDSSAPFVAEADEALPLGGPSAVESYLSADRLLEAAALSGADAVHPGYGFLSENPSFAEQVIGAGLTWVGPTAEAIRMMGDKSAAKDLARSLGVPTLELGGDDLPFPLLVKAAAGGGGRGMRVVPTAGELDEALEAAAREAEASFGNGRVFLEPFLERARHIEVQVLADKYGSVLHLFERECSIQRRHQKLVEECPSSAVGPELRDALTRAAVSIANAVSYESTGTVEFLVPGDADSFYFLEMNTRLQVEHPVTEEVTGVDLVREQIRIAEGEPLSFDQSDVSLCGHAIEVRICAEDPSREFLPTHGRVNLFAPAAEPSLRWESGIEQGTYVSPDFDSMIAKAIAVAPTRHEAALRLALGLERTRLSGIVTNRDYLVGVLRSTEFLSGDTTTDFVERVRIPARLQLPPEVVLQAAVCAALSESGSRTSHRPLPGLRPGWRNSVMPPQVTRYSETSCGHLEVSYRWHGGATVEVSARSDPEVGAVLEGTASVLSAGSGVIRVELSGRRVNAELARMGSSVSVRLGSHTVELLQRTSYVETGTAEVASGALVSPMPGKVVRVAVASGEEVREGHLLVVVEAMKMEHQVTALHAGVVSDVRVTEGAQVEPGTPLVVVTRAEGDDG